jgi:hypothetical protein
MRKLAAVAFIAVAFVLLGSCGGGGSPTTPVAQQPTTTTTSTTTTTTTLAPTPDPRGFCDGVLAPNRCDVGSGSPPATARCSDGLWSCSETRSGTCSGHGGVACYVCPGPLC